MLGRDVIVIGGSAGSYQALVQVAADLPRGLAASVFLALHVNVPDQVFLVREIANRSGQVPAHGAVDGEPILPGHIYVAPGGYNTLVERGRVRVRESPREHLFHPSINALFRSAAVAYGPRVVGVVLSGLHNDGAAGLWEIKQRGGIAIVQSPDEATYPQMPRSALASVAVDYCVTVAEMPPLIEKLVREPLPKSPGHGAAPTRVLIVEDESIVALNLQRRLREHGYVVSAVVSSGEAAVRVVAADPPDVVLMDIVLPGVIDGTEAAAAIWDRFHVPVVYLTAHDDEETLAKVKATQPYGYVLKPLDFRRVHAAIQLALDRRDKESPPV